MDYTSDLHHSDPDVRAEARRDWVNQCQQEGVSHLELIIDRAPCEYKLPGWYNRNKNKRD